MLHDFELKSYPKKLKFWPKQKQKSPSTEPYCSVSVCFLIYSLKQKF